jgi:RNA polymerase sigma-70 factor (ECF subfamily)
MYNITDVKQLQEQIALYNEMSAYKTLYDIFYPSLFRFSYSILKSKEVAEEIVSDVFIKVWQMRNELNKIDALKF